MRRKASELRTSGNPLHGTAPHLDHFDASKFGPNGAPLRSGKPAPRGRLAKIRTTEEVEQIMFLEQIAIAAARDLLEHLESKGFNTASARAEILNRLRNGWRPAR